MRWRAILLTIFCLLLPSVAWGVVQIYGGNNTIVKYNDPVFGSGSDIRVWNVLFDKNLISPFKSASSTVVLGNTNTNTDAVLEVWASTTAKSIYANNNINATGTIEAGADLVFYGEVRPDGATCTNGQILKRTAANDWDCAADAGGASGDSGAWSTLWANTLAPTNTSAGIYVYASSTFDGTLRIDGNATATGAFAYTSGVFNSCTALETDANGTLLCGADAGGGGADGQNGAWQTLWANTLTPTNTSAGVYVYASSTFDGALRLDGDTTSTGRFIARGAEIVLGNSQSTTRPNAISVSDVLDTIRMGDYDQLDHLTRFVLDTGANKFDFNNGVIRLGNTDGLEICTLANGCSGLLMTGGDFFMQGDATSTAADVNTLRVRGLTGSTQCLQVGTNGQVSGTGSACGAGGGGADGQNGAWQAIWANTLAPTNTSAGFYVYASSTVKTSFRVDGNGTTTGSWAIGDVLHLGADFLTDLTGSGLQITSNALTLDTSGTWSGNAGTATALAANGGNCSAGNYPLGVDASGATETCTPSPVGQSGLWQNIAGAYNTPTNTLGIILQGASSTIPGLHAIGLTVSSTAVFDNATVTDSLGVSGSVIIGTNLDLTSGSILNYYGAGCSAGNAIQDIADNGAFTCTATGGGGGGYAEFIQVGDNQQNVSTTPFKLAQGVLASTTAIFDRATITDSLQVNGSIQIGTNLDLTSGSILNYYGTACASGSAITDIADNGTFTCDTNVLITTELDTFSELNTLVADKTLVNEEDAVIWDSLHIFNGNIVVSTPSSTITRLRVPDLLTASTTLAGAMTIFGNLDMDAGSITNYFGAACTGNNWVQDIADNGIFSCGALSTAGDWTGTLDGDNASAFARAGVNGAWQTILANVLAPTNTSAAIIVQGASSTMRSLVMDGNATTTGYLVVGTTQPKNNFSAGDFLWGGKATGTTALWLGSGGSALFTNAAGGDIFAQDGIEAGGGLFASGSSTTTATTTVGGTSTGGGVKIYTDSSKSTSTIEFL